MSFVHTGIEDVRVLVLPDGVAGDGRSIAVSRMALVTWRSSNVGMLHQVYLDGRLAGATIDVEQRRIPVQVSGSLLSAARVVVIAVESQEAHVDFAGEVEQAGAAGDRIRLTVLRSQTLPADAAVNVYYDGGVGQIDYVTPLNDSPIPIWPCAQDKAGLGLGCFGEGDFGYEAAATVGFGKGTFGRGEFGLDADLMEWIGPALPAGQYRFGVKITDGRGNESAPSEIGPVSIVPPATPAAGLGLVTFDPDNNELVLCATP
jgi:hypothetical protein